MSSVLKSSSQRVGVYVHAARLVEERSDTVSRETGAFQLGRASLVHVLSAVQPE